MRSLLKKHRCYRQLHRGAASMAISTSTVRIMAPAHRGMYRMAGREGGISGARRTRAGGCLCEKRKTSFSRQPSLRHRRGWRHGRGYYNSGVSRRNHASGSINNGDQ